jgi:transcriptional regulator with XRE-family HTH domain
MRTSRSERDYLFGSTMLSLRTAISLKQAELASLLGISRLAVGKWEGGINYPKAEHLKKVIALGVKCQAFPAGREAEEIRALWKAAHQKVLLDEDWLSVLLSQPHSPQGQGYGWLHDESAYIGQIHRKNAIGRMGPTPVRCLALTLCLVPLALGTGSALVCMGSMQGTTPTALAPPPIRQENNANGLCTFLPHLLSLPS